ncbi:MAG: hypothetical protein KUA43_11440 [Hoeflea sp.]|uniref:DUF6880 family protein n=1 Tax=Hoeflea sp. TaxID=1940281 RepID=UPI001D8E7D27|nr:DUF6880 family protein [Hoeflea sp.]MBU4527623.1 hypothetical protein [Alphaproteobacteria bacterium]MBU4546509.1 hypothetical protein [Alphaproteobacteria bacterium]MBU4552973.1 hypothetical protein [Alphaproteobacteria bacterium]MBV1724045.1 hypothetical protein [Hoeflea sp.]MBV1759730.1 hypothetical protein [Hoeflea sp.]
MAPGKTLNAKNLEALGAPRLAELLIEISTGSAASKRRLRLELAGSQGSKEVALVVRKRLASIARARTFINWRKVKALRKDLETQRTTIVDALAPEDPSAAFELIWQFLALGDSIFARSDDGSGALIESFRQACIDAGVIARLARINADVLADKVFTAMQNDEYGQYDGLSTAMAPALGKEGLERLKTLFVQWSREPQETPAPQDRQVIGWGPSGPMYEDEIYGNYRDLTVRIALQDIADAMGDVDAYVAQQSENSLRAPGVATEIANRLLAAGRADEALEVLDAADAPGTFGPVFGWQQARAETLEALDRTEEAQAYRWSCFEQSLNDEHLRAYLRRLPDFDDMEAEERACSYALAFSDVHQALDFLLRWPALEKAAQLVINRQSELDGNLYGLLTPAAEMLQEKHPLAATLVLRSMIDFTLGHARSSRYRHAARHLSDCQALAHHIEDFGDTESHDVYVAGLKSSHGKKQGFWKFLD